MVIRPVCLSLLSSLAVTSLASPPAQVAVQSNLAAKAPAAPHALAAMVPGTSFRDCVVCPEMIVVPAGGFMMGATGRRAAAWPSEGPPHRVTISRAFAVGKYEVTFDEWDACVAERSCSHDPDDSGWGRQRRPVINILWQDAKQYVAWLSRKTGKRYRLPSEAEWEYVARAGTTTAYSTGATIRHTQANAMFFQPTSPLTTSGRPESPGKTAPVGSYPPNAFGLHDVHGNVWEWVEDCWNSSYEGAPADGSAWRSGNCASRVQRGGAWNEHPSFIGSAMRSHSYPGSRLNNNGLRVARD